MWDKFLHLFDGITLLPFTMAAAISIGIVVLLLILSGYMSSSETAFFSLDAQDIDAVKQSNSPQDRKLLHLLGHSDRLLATILIGNNVVNIAIVLISSYVISSLIDFGEAHVVSFLLQTVVLTMLILFFGEIAPKVYAQSHPLQFSRFSAVIITPLFQLLKPIANALVGTSNRVAKKGGRSEILSVDDLSKAVELTIDKSAEESEMIDEIIKFYDKTAVEIMVPRVDMEAIDEEWDFRSVLDFIVETGYSRIPVYRDTQDTIVGILYIKDCLAHLHEDKDFDWHKLIRPAYFVPENKKLDDLLEDFRRDHVHISIVVDEYGGTSGLITMEDILEEIVGEITDEYDDDEVPYIVLPDGSLLIDAKTPINDFCRLLSIDSKIFDEVAQEVDTLGGIYLEVKRDLPRKGGVVLYAGIHFEVVSLEKRRIIQMKVTLPPSLRASANLT